MLERWLLNLGDGMQLYFLLNHGGLLLLLLLLLHHLLLRLPLLLHHLLLPRLRPFASDGSYPEPVRSKAIMII
jgi:hypothetical protein